MAPQTKMPLMLEVLADEVLALNPPKAAKSISLLESYQQNVWRGTDVVRELIVSDITDALDLGLVARAADLLLVLRRFLILHPEAQADRT